MVTKHVRYKVIDEVTPVRCAAGLGLNREEVWENATGEVIRYNLAFINRFLIATDHGRVLGYDNSHGYHHRHLRGTVERFEFTSYRAVFDRFLDEVEQLRREQA